MADPARSAALDLLAGVLERGESLADQTPALAAGPEAAARLAPADRARAQRLATMVLRQLAPLDRALQPFLKKAPPLAVRNILRLALSELASGAAPHGVVHGAVEAAREINPAFSGMTNAILRRIDPGLVKGTNRLPDWLRLRLIAAWGNRAVEGMERVFARPAPLDLTLHPKAAPDRAALGGELLPSGTLRLAPGAQVSTLPGYEAGAFWVQDAAAALAVRLLGDVAGLRILDLCAAPGGKTMQLAAAGAEVVSLDISAPRLERLRANLARTRLQAEVVAADALHWAPEAPFDAILLDAPCSATGTIRRHPDLPHLRRPEDVVRLVQLQQDLADRARGWLKPQGRLVFCTCSLLPEEGEAQAARLVDLGMKALRPEVAGVEPGWWGDHGLRLRPDYWEKAGGMDGFYMAVLAR